MDQRLMDYLKNVIYLEQELYTQQNVLNKLTSKYNSLGKGQHKKTGKMSLSNTVVGTSIGLIIGLPLVGVIIGFVFGLLNWHLTAGEGAKKGLLISLAVAVAVDAIILLCGFASSSSEHRKAAAETEKYNSDLDQRLAREAIQKNNLSPLISQMKDRISKTKSELSQYYNVGALFPKYRNFTAVCSIYEYLLSGRCSTLEGHEGAYNIYENELYLKTIVGKIDDILDNLNAIRYNQATLYNAINEGNKKISQLTSLTMEQTRLTGMIASNSAITAYCTQQIASDTKMMSFLQYYSLT